MAPFQTTSVILRGFLCVTLMASAFAVTASSCKSRLGKASLREGTNDSEKKIVFDGDAKMSDAELTEARKIQNAREKELAEYQARHRERCSQVEQQLKNMFAGPSAAKVIEQFMGMVKNIYNQSSKVASNLVFVGPPGVGKNAIVETAMELLDLNGSYHRRTFTGYNDNMSPAEVLEMTQKKGEFLSPKVLFLDEVQRSNGAGQFDEKELRKTLEANFNIDGKSERIQKLRDDLEKVQDEGRRGSLLGQINNAEKELDSYRAHINSQISYARDSFKQTAEKMRETVNTIRDLASGNGFVSGVSGGRAKPTDLVMEIKKELESHFTSMIAKGQAIPASIEQLKKKEEAKRNEVAALEIQLKNLEGQKEIEAQKESPNLKEVDDLQAKVEAKEAEVAIAKSALEDLTDRFEEYKDFRDTLVSGYLRELIDNYPEILEPLTTAFRAQNPDGKWDLVDDRFIVATILMKKDAKKALDIMYQKAMATPEKPMRDGRGTIIVWALNPLETQQKAIANLKGDGRNPDDYRNAFLDAWREGGEKESWSILQRWIGDEKNWQSMQSRLGDLFLFSPMGTVEWQQAAAKMAKWYVEKYTKDAKDIPIKLSKVNVDPSVGVISTKIYAYGVKGLRSMDPSSPGLYAGVLDDLLIRMKGTPLQNVPVTISLKFDDTSKSMVARVEADGNPGIPPLTVSRVIPDAPSLDSSPKKIAKGGMDFKLRSVELASVYTMGSLLFQSVPENPHYDSRTDLNFLELVREKWPDPSTMAKGHWQYELKVMLVALAAIEADEIHAQSLSPNTAALVTEIRDQHLPRLLANIESQARTLAIAPNADETLVGAWFRREAGSESTRDLELYKILGRATAENKDVTMRALLDLVKKSLQPMIEVGSATRGRVTDGLVRNLALDFEQRGDEKPMTANELMEKLRPIEAGLFYPAGNASLSACYRLVNQVLDRPKAQYGFMKRFFDRFMPKPQ